MIFVVLKTDIMLTNTSLVNYHGFISLKSLGDLFASDNTLKGQIMSMFEL